MRARSRATDLASIVLRHFLVLGSAHASLVDTGAQTVVSMVLADLDAGRAPRIHGTDYPTVDGTCIGDVVHIGDLADAHVLALGAFAHVGGEFRVDNVGTAVGTSVRQLVEGVRSRVRDAPAAALLARRADDAAIVVADLSRTCRDLAWRPRFSVDDMLDSAVGPVLAV